MFTQDIIINDNPYRLLSHNLFKQIHQKEPHWIGHTYINPLDVT